MTRERAIQRIEGLYPADSEYEDTARIGKELLGEIVSKMWRELPDELLFEYMASCNAKHGQ